MPEYTPSELLRKYQCQSSVMTGQQFFRSPVLQRLREMWCAARFGAGIEQHMTACTVLIDHLDDQRSGDFFLRFEGGLTRLFKVFEVQREGRRRGDEHRDRPSGSQWLEEQMDPVEAAELI